MRVILNVGVVLMCGTLAALSSLARSVPTQAAVLPVSMGQAARSPAAGAGALPFLTSVRRSGGIEAHFEAANTSHDGRLTRDQAERADWPRVARHFDEIDTDHRGWITVEQIHAFNRAHRTHRRGGTG